MQRLFASRGRVTGHLVILGAILGLHLVVLGWLGLTSVPQPSASPAQPPFVIELQPRRLGTDAPTSTTHSALATPAAPRDARLLRYEAVSALPFQRTTPGQMPNPPASPEATTPQPPVPDAAIARALRNSALGCRLGGLDPADQVRCDRALAEATTRAAPVRGTGNPTRDARFAALGAEQLARYEDKRKTLKPYSRTEPCPASPSPSDPCAFSVQGRIWSSRDGWLPDLPRPQ